MINRLLFRYCAHLYGFKIWLIKFWALDQFQSKIIIDQFVEEPFSHLEIHFIFSAYLFI